MKKIILCVVCAMLITALLNVCFARGHIYDDAEIMERPGVGTISICRVPEKACTLEALNDWYYNYILVTDCDQYMIFYSDSSKTKGVFGTKEGVEMTVSFAQDSKGWYVGSEKYAVWYLPSGEDGLVLALGC